ncbi:MAG: hypothetical protein HYR84_06470 [Planctomycetes bacterium]|nr:hypothetical protein [Planctomycetota bacterium]
MVPRNDSPLTSGVCPRSPAAVTSRNQPGARPTRWDADGSDADTWTIRLLETQEHPDFTVADAGDALRAAS